MRILRVPLQSPQQVFVMLTGLVAGGPVAGLALDPPETTLLISSLNPATGRAQVIVHHKATSVNTVYDQTISQSFSAGGLQRARLTNDFVWADLTAGGLGSGRVIKVTLF